MIRLIFAKKELLNALLDKSPDDLTDDEVDMISLLVNDRDVQNSLNVKISVIEMIEMRD